MINIENLNPIFICGHRASGGGLLTGLLDFHPELLVYPDESKFFYLFYPIMNKDDISSSEKINYLIKNNLEFLKNILFEKCNGDSTYFNFDLFIKRFEELASNGVNWHNYLKAMIQTYSEISPQEKKMIKYWVERTSSSEIYAKDIVDAFPKAKFIHILRDPRDNYASLKSRWDEKLQYLSDSSSLESLIQSCIERCRLGLEMGLMNKKLFGKEKYFFSKYEDLVKNLDNSLGRIATFLDINPNLFSKTPTFCGLPWIGNNFSGKLFKGVSPIQVGRWRERITEDEAALIEFHFKDLMKIFGYKMEFSYSQHKNLKYYTTMSVTLFVSL